MSAVNILVVDDSKTVREVIVKTLGMAGVETNEIHQAANGEEALRILKDSWVDLVFSDINMPVMNGIEMIERMKDDEVLKTIPIVVVTTEGSATRIEKLKERGITTYIRKPFTPEDIRNVVEELLGNGHATSHKELVENTFCKIVEKMAFMFGEMPDEVTPSEAVVDAVEASISFEGYFNGTITLAAPASLCAELSANTLGLEPSDPQAIEKGHDALKELLNVVCGNILTAIAGEEPVFDLSIPELKQLDPAAWESRKSEDRTSMVLVDEVPVLLRLTLAD